MDHEQTLSSIAKIAAALAKAQGKIESAKKDKTNPHFKSTYATLASVWDACRGPLSENEIAVIQAPEMIGDQLILRTTLMHSSGETLSCLMPISVASSAPAQALGSALTYARRYSLATMVGVAPDDDDDGNEATKAPPQPAQNKIEKPASFWEYASYELPKPKPGEEKAWLERIKEAVAKAPTAKALTKLQADNSKIIDSFVPAITHDINELINSRYADLDGKAA